MKKNTLGRREILSQLARVNLEHLQNRVGLQPAQSIQEFLLPDPFILHQTNKIDRYYYFILDKLILYLIKMNKIYLKSVLASRNWYRCSSIKPVFERSEVRKLIQQSKFSQQILKNINSLEQNLNSFSNNFQNYRQIAEKSSVHNIVLFARTCLIAQTYKYIRRQQYYPTVKRTISAKMKEITPFNAVLLLQLFGYFKWEGDQYKIIEQLTGFYEKKCYLFSKEEEIGFWEFYVKIMGKKIHDSSKFQNLERKKRETIQQSSVKLIAESLLDLKQVNKRIVKQITIEKDEEIMVHLKKPGIENLDILMKIRPILDFNQYSTQQYQSFSYNFEIKKTILKETKSIDSALKKGWNIFLLGVPFLSKDKDVDYHYKIKQGGYVGTDKISVSLEGNQESLNSLQKLDSLRLCNKYISGIFYDSTDPKKRKIDTNSTIFLSIPSKYFSTRYIKFFEEKKQTSNLISPYLTTNQLKQIYGLSKKCQFYQEFFNSYIRVQSIMNKLIEVQMKKNYMIDEIQEFINMNRLNKEEKKLFLSSNIELLSSITMENANQIKNLQLDNRYTWSQRSVNSSLANNCKGNFWQAQPLFPEVVRIIQAAQQIYQNQKNSNNNTKETQTNKLKVKILISRRKFPYFLKHLLENKYWTVPKLNLQNIDSSQKELRSTLLSQLF